MRFKGKILFLTQIVPYPPDAGPRVKTWNVLRFLASRGYEIVLVTYVRPEEEAALDTVRQVCAQVHSVSIQRSRVRDAGYWLKSLVSGRPFLVERDDHGEMRKTIEYLLDTQDFDIVHADQLTMAQFALPLSIPHANGPAEDLPESSPRLVLDAHNAVWTILDRMRETAARPLQPILALEANRIQHYEGKVVASFDRTLAVSQVDRQALVQAVGAYSDQASGVEDKIAVIPIAVDTDRLQPIEPATESKNIVTLGTLHYPPNADGIRWFLANVFPKVRERVPEASLTIIGKNPPADLKSMADNFGASVQVTGYVPDLDPFMEQAAALVVPVRAGGGMRVRILEGFARGMPMVTTTVGLEGIEARAGRDILVADAPNEFAEALTRLLNDRQLRQWLAANGRQLAVDHYDSQVVLDELFTAYTTTTHE